MQIKISFDTFDGRAFSRAVMKGARNALEATAKAAIIDQTQRIPMRVDPQGGAQRENSNRTKKRKSKKLGHTVPLMGFENKLRNKSLYKIKRKSGGGVVSRTVHLPPDREQIVKYLRDLGYRYWEVSPELKRFSYRAWAAEMRGLEARISQFVLSGG